MSDEPFAYGIQAPIGSVTPLFHKRKDAEDYVAKLTDSRDDAKIIPLYRAAPGVETMLDCWHKTISQYDALSAEVARLRLTKEERTFLQNLRGAYEAMAAQTGYVNGEAQKEACTHAKLLCGLLERTEYKNENA